MSTIKNLIKSIYRGFKSDERERKALTREGKLSKKPVDPAEQKYKQERRIERYERRPYEGESDTLYDEYESGNRDEAKRYLRKSRRGEISKEDLDDRIRHKDDAEQDHDPAGDAAEAEEWAGCQVGQRFHGAELLHDITCHISDGCTVAGDPCGELPLQRYRKLIEPDRNDSKQAHGHKALDGIERGFADVAPPAGILDTAFKAGHDQPGSVQRPSEIGEEQYDALHPGHFEEFDTHVSHLCEEVAEKAHDLTVEPIHDLAEDLIGNKIPNKH